MKFSVLYGSVCSADKVTESFEWLFCLLEFLVEGLEDLPIFDQITSAETWIFFESNST